MLLASALIAKRESLEMVRTTFYLTFNSFMPRGSYFTTKYLMC